MAYYSIDSKDERTGNARRILGTIKREVIFIKRVRRLSSKGMEEEITPASTWSYLSPATISRSATQPAIRGGVGAKNALAG